MQKLSSHKSFEQPCSNCGLTDAESPRAPRSDQGLQSRCRLCVSAFNKAARDAKREHLEKTTGKADRKFRINPPAWSKAK